MLEIQLVEMFLGDGTKEVVVVTSSGASPDQRIFHTARHFFLEVTENGEVTLTTEEE